MCSTKVGTYVLAKGRKAYCQSVVMVVFTAVGKSLVEEVGRLELPGRPLIYGTTAEFLRCFNVSSLSELPELPRENNEAEDEKGEENEKNSDIEGTDLQLEVDEKQNLM